MSKLYFLILFFLFIGSQSFAQIDVLEAPSESEKAEVNRILKEYQNYMNAQGDSILPKEKKALATLKIVKELVNNNVQVYNDLDSTGEDKFVKLLSYPQKLKEVYPQTVITSLTNLQLEKVKYDKIRRYYFIKANAVKNIEWKRIVIKTIKDSITLKDTLLKDTLKFIKSRPISFYIRFDKVSGLSKNFKLYAISRQGGEPMLDPLPAIMIWWLEMEPQWKSYFRDKYKLEEYPTTWEIEKITGQTELDISGKQFKTLEPLRQMVFLQKLNCSNTPITKLEPVAGLSTLLELDISFSKIEDLTGIETLNNLQSLKCKGLKLKTIAPVKNLTSLIKLDCSENELIDITPVSELVNLKELDFSSNVKIEDIKPVAKLVLMEKLAFAKVKAGSLEPLRNLVNLIHLNCFNTEVNSLEPIRNHQKIIYLNLDHNPVTTLEPIKNYKFIVELSLATSSVTDLTPIKDFVYMKSINVANTQITTLGPVLRLENIRVLQCQMTKVPKEEVARFKKNHPGSDITYFY